MKNGGLEKINFSSCHIEAPRPDAPFNAQKIKYYVSLSSPCTLSLLLEFMFC